jgi:tRNA-dihydrouridine synthase B
VFTLGNFIDIIQNRAVLAPMAGITDQPFRLTVKQQGASLMFTELVSAEGLIRSSLKTRHLMEFYEEERPIAVQIFGKCPEAMARAAQIAEALKPELIDLNFGCPAKKVIRAGGGSAVQRDPDLLKAIVGRVTRLVSTPVSCKIRSGWDGDHINAEEIARIIEGEGASLITLHPRTTAQGFSGSADWSLIARVKHLVKIPVIGNGDIIKPEDARRMMDETGCDAVMIGRGILGRPWLLSYIDEFLSSGRLKPEPEETERIRIGLAHFDLALKIHGTLRGVKEMRKHLGWTIRGIRGVSQIRYKLMTLEDPDKVREFLMQFMEFLEQAKKIEN